MSTTDIETDANVDLDTETDSDQVVESSEDVTEETNTTEDDDQGDDGQGDGDTFPREYVEKLRGQNAKYRDRAKVADTYAQRLHTEMVRATGRLADPTDIPFDEGHLDDPDALVAAIDELLARKPHLASRKPVGDIGQGNRGGASQPFSLLGLLKERT